MIMGTETIELNKALAKVQKAVLSAPKDATNPHFGRKYATLAGVLEVIRAPLADNGFALIQDADTDLEKQTVGVTTRLIHESGAELTSARLSAPLKMEFTKDGKQLPPGVQQIGSLVTYLRRYSLCAFLSVAVEDDDGNMVSDIGKETVQTQQPKSNRTSAYTGEKLDTPAAVEHHKAAAEEARKQPAVIDEKKETPANGETKKRVEGVSNAALAEAMFRDKITVEGLEGYLGGSIGNPKISNALLKGGMKLGSLGDRIVSSLLNPNNWGMVVQRIHADDSYVPF
jgi:hypothetical protein